MFQFQVEQLLADPKNADEDGDYFEDMRVSVCPCACAHSSPAKLECEDL